jgi:hypothetical protein
MSNIFNYYNNNNGYFSNLSPGLHFTPGEGDVYEFILDSFFENKYQEKQLLESLFDDSFFNYTDSQIPNQLSDELSNSIDIIKNKYGGFSCLLYPKDLSKNTNGSIILLDKYLSKLTFPKEFYNGSVHSDFRKSLFEFESDYRNKLGEKYYLAIYSLLSLFVAIDKSLMICKIEDVTPFEKFIDIWSGIKNSFIGTSDLFCFLEDLDDLEDKGELEGSENNKSGFSFYSHYGYIDGDAYGYGYGCKSELPSGSSLEYLEPDNMNYLK